MPSLLATGDSAAARALLDEIANTPIYHDPEWYARAARARPCRPHPQRPRSARPSRHRRARPAADPAARPRRRPRIQAELAGDHAAAAVLYADAAQRWEQFTATIEQAHALLAQGRCLTHTGDPTADQPLRHARTLFHQMGARPRSGRVVRRRPLVRTRSIHLHDKRALYAEAFRVLRPGGRLLVGDWLRGDDPSLTPQVEAFVVAAGHGFAMVSREEVVALVESVGFGEVESEDRGLWYTAEAQAELERLRGEMRAEFVDRWGEAAAQAELDFWEVLVTSLEGGALNPAHVRARKPMQT